MNQHTDGITYYQESAIQHNLPIAQVTMEMLIDFDLNSTDVKPKYHKGLTKVANFLRQNESVTATIEGHAISLPTMHVPIMEISKHRAQNVVNHLVNFENIPRSRLTAEGLVQANLFVYNNIGAQQENFRIYIIFSYQK